MYTGSETDAIRGPAISGAERCPPHWSSASHPRKGRVRLAYKNTHIRARLFVSIFLVFQRNANSYMCQIFWCRCWLGANVWVNWEFVSWIVCALLRLLDERSRLQYRLKLTLQELEHLRSNEKRYESESAGMNNSSLSVSVCLCLSHTHTTDSDCMRPCLADWLHTHSALLERVMRHGREGGR